MTKEQVVAALQGLPPGGPRLHLAMRLLKKSQGHIATKLNLSQPTVSQIVTDKRPTSPEERAVIAKALKLTVEDLFGQEAA